MIFTFSLDALRRFYEAKLTKIEFIQQTAIIKFQKLNFMQKQDFILELEFLV